MILDKKSGVYLPDKNKKILVHIHIPRTGGRFLSQYHQGKPPVVDNILHLGHCYIIEDTKDFKRNPVMVNNTFLGFHGILPLSIFSNKSIVSIVRNPFDLLPSMYEYWCNKDKSFKGWIKDITTTYDYEWPNSRFLFTQLFTDKGKFICDWLCRTETLNDDLEFMGEHYGLEYTPSDKVNSSNRKNYKEYYDDELIDLVYKVWGREIELFGYSFDTLECNKDNEFHNLISDELKDKYIYIYAEDKLYGMV